MAQSLTSIFVHIVFSTKHREPVLDKQIQPHLYNYIGGICREYDCNPVKIGGCADHVHILCILSKKITLIKLVEEIKKNSSKWIKLQDKRFEAFFWQNGYGAFSISTTHVAAVAKYIEMQEAHHKNLNFQDELRNLLSKNKMQYDEKYLWD